MIRSLETVSFINPQTTANSLLPSLAFKLTSDLFLYILLTFRLVALQHCFPSCEEWIFMSSEKFDLYKTMQSIFSAFSFVVLLHDVVVSSATAVPIGYSKVNLSFSNFTFYVLLDFLFKEVLFFCQECD